MQKVQELHKCITAYSFCTHAPVVLHYCTVLNQNQDWDQDRNLGYYIPMDMNIAVSLVVVLIALFFGSVFALFPRWGMKIVCRCARSYMNEDLSSDPVYVLAFRFYGMAAVGLGLYALNQVLQAF